MVLLFAQRPAVVEYLALIVLLGTVLLLLLLAYAAVRWRFSKPQLWIGFPDGEWEPSGCCSDPDVNKWSSRLRVGGGARPICHGCRLRITRVDELTTEDEVMRQDILPGGVDLRWSHPVPSEIMDVSFQNPGIVELYSMGDDCIFVPSAESHGAPRALPCGDKYYGFEIEAVSTNAPSVTKYVIVHCAEKRERPLMYLDADRLT